jgi:hypothetical protein
MRLAINKADAREGCGLEFRIQYKKLDFAPTIRASVLLLRAEQIGTK